MTKYYRATFASGHVEVRSTKTRAYVACVVGWYQKGSYSRASWCGPGVSPHTRATTEFKTAERVEISTAVVQITAKEYRAHSR